MTDINFDEIIKHMETENTINMCKINHNNLKNLNNDLSEEDNNTPMDNNPNYNTNNKNNTEETFFNSNSKFEHKPITKNQINQVNQVTNTPQDIFNLLKEYKNKNGEDDLKKILGYHNKLESMKPDPNIQQNEEEDKLILSGLKPIYGEKNKLECPVCLSSAVNPQNAKCGHILCSECWKTCLSNKLECPLCKQKVREKQLTNIYI